MNSDVERRLDPFAFPSETQLRSVLLVVAVLALAWRAGMLFSQTLALGSELPTLNFEPVDVLGLRRDLPTSPVESFVELQRRLQAESGQLAESPERRHQFDTALDRVAAERVSFALQLSPFVLLPTAFCLLAAGFLALAYRTHTWRLERGRRSNDLAALDSASWAPPLHKLIDEARHIQQERGEPLPEPVVKVSLDGSYRLGGRAYGFPGRYILRLRRSVPAELRSDLRRQGRPHRVRALLLHELAHIANHDVARAFRAEAAGILLVVLAFFFVVLPPILWLEGSRVAWWQPSLLIQLALTVGLIEFNRRRLLYQREHFADLRVAWIWRAFEPLREVLTGIKGTATAEVPLDPHEKTGDRWSRLSGQWTDGKAWRAWGRWIRQLWAKHPTDQERSRTLKSYDDLFRVRGSICFFAGFLYSYLVVVTALASSILVQIAWALGAGLTITATRWLLETGSPFLALRLYYQYDWVMQIILIVPAALLLYWLGAYLLAGTVGLQVQSESVARMDRARQGCGASSSLLTPAFWLILGLEAGLLCAPFSIAMPARPASLWALAVWLPLATLSIWLWMVAARYFARQLLGSHTGSRPPVARRRVLTVALTFLLCGALLPPLAGQLVFTQLGVSTNITVLDLLVLAATGVAVFGVVLVLTWLGVGTWVALAAGRSETDEQILPSDGPPRWLELERT